MSIWLEYARVILFHINFNEEQMFREKIGEGVFEGEYKEILGKGVESRS